MEVCGILIVPYYSSLLMQLEDSDRPIKRARRTSDTDVTCQVVEQNASDHFSVDLSSSLQNLLSLNEFTKTLPNLHAFLASAPDTSSALDIISEILLHPDFTEIIACWFRPILLDLFARQSLNLHLSLEKTANEADIDQSIRERLENFMNAVGYLICIVPQMLE